MQTPVMDATQLNAYLTEIFPQIEGDFVVEDAAPMVLRGRLIVREKHLRPGGTVSGPAQFMLADCAFYAAILSMIGNQPMAVTTSLSLNFMRRPAAQDLIAEARIMKMGRNLVVGDVYIQSLRDKEILTHAQVTYSLPRT